jgi:phosphatidylinositol glycan class V
MPISQPFSNKNNRNVGFLRYWTPNQLPLFLLASPVLALLITSGIQVLREPSSTLKLLAPGTNEPFRLLMRSLAATQTLVALLAITNYHVQVINRLSSGYVVWYWWIAGCLLAEEDRRRTIGLAVVVFFVMYAGIQGSLFASFLPPA